jgi:hypothetical protein
MSARPGGTAPSGIVTGISQLDLSHRWGNTEPFVISVRLPPCATLSSCFCQCFLDAISSKTGGDENVSCSTPLSVYSPNLDALKHLGSILAMSVCACLRWQICL